MMTPGSVVWQDSDGRRAIRVGALWLVIAMCGCPKTTPPVEPKAVRPGTLVVGLSQEPSTLWIPFQEMMAAEEVTKAAGSCLTTYDDNWRIIPWVAEDIPSRENGGLVFFDEDGRRKMRVRWRLRGDFMWADGVPLTADDFVFAWRLYRDPRLPTTNRVISQKVEQMTAEGDDHRTLVVTWSEPFASYHSYCQHEALPQHRVAELYANNPDAMRSDTFGVKPVLAGGFSVDEWVSGSHVMVSRNPFLKGPMTPYFEHIVWRFIPSSAQLIAHLMSGSIDAISPTGMSLLDGIALESRVRDRFRFYFVEGLGWEHIDFNLEHPALQDRRVRQALAYGVDRQRMVTELFAGRQRVAHGTQSPRSMYHHPGVRKYEYSVDKATELLDSAGWLLGDDDVRRKDGVPLQLELTTTLGDEERARVQDLIHHYWSALGILVERRSIPPKIFFGETLPNRQYGALAMYASIQDPFDTPESMWMCASVPGPANHHQGQNYSGWCQPKAEKLLVEAGREFDSARRAELMRQFEEIFAEELPALPLYFRVEVSVTRRELENWKPTGTLQPVSWNAHRWKWSESAAPTANE